MEYAFVKPDGTAVFEIITSQTDVHALRIRHGALSAVPIEQFDRHQARLAIQARTPGMDFLMLHGRDTPDKDMDDWGFNGPTLEGVLWVHFTYMQTLTIGFNNAENFNKAQELTGWPHWDELILEMKFEDDLLLAGGKYYGDWELQVPGS